MRLPHETDRSRPIAARVDELLAEARRIQRASLLDDELIEAHQFHGMIGRGPAMMDVFGAFAGSRHTTAQC